MWRTFLCISVLVASALIAAEPTKLRLVADLNPGPNSSVMADFFVAKGKAWFRAATTQGGKTVWSLFVTDGSTAGTRRLKDFGHSNFSV